MKAWKFFKASSLWTLAVAVSATLLTLAGCKSGTGTESPQLPEPEWTANRPRIDVESLKDNIDLDMDISQLTVSELRVLRNALAARQGYIFMTAELRNIFEQTSWYDRLMMARWSYEEDGMDEWWDPDDKEGAALFEIAKKPIAYTDEEQAFIDRIKAREKELLENNFKMGDGFIVNVDNVVNIYQKEGLGWEARQVDEDRVTLQSAPITKGNALRSKLAEQGFAIIEGQYDQLFQVYEKNDYHNFPSFVTTDLYLQTFHLYFDVILRKVEVAKFTPRLVALCEKMHDQLQVIASTTSDPKVRKAAEHAVAYFAIGHTLLTGKQSLSVPIDLQKLVSEELQLIEKEEDAFSDFLDYHDAYFMYSLFRPRGHYTRTPELKRYFKAMMWLQTAPFIADKPAQMLEAALIGQVLTSDQNASMLYKTLTEPITYLMGTPDNASIIQVADLVKQQGASLTEIANDTKKMEKLQAAVKKLMDEQTRIVPKFQATSIYKINLMPQRFMPDALVLQEMVDYDSPKTLRPLPKGLDVMAAFGMPAAERILIDELKENETWPKFTETLNRMKKESDPSKWDSNVANEWVKTLTTLQADKYETPKPDGTHPAYFMYTPQWDKKNLNTALASWAELKHDAILYAKQPMGAECGGGGPEEPICMGYVEPNVKFWQKAIDLLTETQDVFSKFDLSTEETERYTTALYEEAEFFLRVSKKELAGQKLTDEEYRELEYVGAQFEYISLDMMREPDQWLQDWNAVEGADKKVSVVADVYTANAYNNEEKSVLYAAVGPACEIYVIVEIDGYLYLTRGAVFSYREFDQLLGEPRLTDEEWQQQLEQQYHRGMPEWMEPLKVPAEDIPADNELFFYSTGC
ncbi:MAG: DUF3160 domain-containing protein [Bacteroidaceae bacterium]|nr:DUF3160 domain-containing protein [Bacteroidaceae bacterium]